MPITSTKTEDFTAALEAAVAEYGADYVYPEEKKAVLLEGSDPQCLYFDTENHSKPLCLIGVALSKLGVTAEDIAAIPPAVAFYPGQDGLSLNANRIMSSFGFSQSTAWAAKWAQTVQDRGEPWGNALAKYRTELGLQTA